MSATQHAQPVPVFVGIDPGAQGAIVILRGDSLIPLAMPTVVEKTSRGAKRPRTDYPALKSILREARERGAQCAHVEDVWGIAGQGAGGAAALGHNVGMIEAACHDAGLPIVWVSAVSWKAFFGLTGKGKAAACTLARGVFGGFASFFRAVRGVRTQAQAEGFADAALIARFAKLTAEGAKGWKVRVALRVTSINEGATL